MQAATSGNTDILSQLLKAGAQVNATDNHGDTALILATRDGTPDAIRTLLSAGADRDLRNKDRANAREIATNLKRAELAALLAAK
jgi:ankyrin repeat protein